MTAPTPGADAAEAAAAAAAAIDDANRGAGAEAIAPGAGAATGGVATTVAGGFTALQPATSAVAHSPCANPLDEPNKREASVFNFIWESVKWVQGERRLTPYHRVLQQIKFSLKSNPLV